ncbi:MAG: hypothetical protein DI527_07610 [Chelatococcus sp.]|nr:MAG: hypothetical protein DI527_07610 [Chelatococcus sp.]
MTRLFAIALIALASSCTQTPVYAHEAMSGWHYPAVCCSDRDCAEVPSAAIEETLDGYVVTVAPGRHPMWPITKPGPLKLAIPYLDSQLSPDGRFHLCIDGTGKLLCFFAAIGGS